MYANDHVFCGHLGLLNVLSDLDDGIDVFRAVPKEAPGVPYMQLNADSVNTVTGVFPLLLTCWARRKEEGSLCVCMCACVCVHHTPRPLEHWLRYVTVISRFVCCIIYAHSVFKFSNPFNPFVCLL